MAQLGIDDYPRRVQHRPPAPPPQPKYDEKTERDVQKVQRENGLPETGRVDKDTLRVLQQKAPGTPASDLGQRVDSHGLLGFGDEGGAVEELRGLLDAYGAPAETPAPAPQAPPPPAEDKGFWETLKDGGRELAGNLGANARNLAGHALANGRELAGDVADYARNQAADLAENGTELVTDLVGNGVEAIRDTVSNGVELARNTAANGRDLAGDLRESPLDYGRDLAEFGARQGGDVAAFGRDQLAATVEYHRNQAGDIAAYGRNQALDTLGNAGNLAQDVAKDGGKLGKDLVQDGTRLGQQALGDAAEGILGVTPAGAYERDVLARLNSNGDKAVFEMNLSLTAEASGKVAKKVNTGIKLLDKFQDKGEALSKNQALKSALGVVSKLGLVATGTGTFSGEVQRVDNKETGAVEYQVTVKETAQLGLGGSIPFAPGAVNKWGEVGGSAETATSATVGTVYTFKSEQEALEGMKLLKKSEATGGLGLVPEETAWLAKRNTGVNFDFAGKAAVGTTAGKEFSAPGKNPILSALVESGQKAEGSTKLSINFPPGKDPELIIEHKATRSREQNAKVTGDIILAEGSLNSQAKVGEDEASVVLKYDLKAGDHPLDFLSGLGTPKAVELKASNTDYDPVVPGDTGRPDSRKTEYSKSFGAGAPVDLLREAGFLSGVLLGKDFPLADADSRGYKVEKTRTDASGDQVGDNLKVTFGPFVFGAGANVQMGVDDTTGVG